MAVSRRFDADVDTVAALMTDPDFIVDRCLAIGELSAECHADEDRDSVTLHTTRVSRQDLPGFLTKLVGEEQTLTVHEIWQTVADGRRNRYQGRYTVRSARAPIEIEGRFTLEADGSGSVYKVEHRFHVPIPLIAGRIEKVLRRQITATVEAELAYAAERLTDSTQ
ncbi:DUF2505 domain-containing protein [Lentisalinibacter sediminis]|uniref:DUF2505 domain-containing protein n=1 Tax=Lentisalinibacter sediminis TaxID=2992237 RepID=UPI00386B4A32